jgi:predicted DCC family thiol-disulfide oxidoreductase YuxK
MANTPYPIEMFFDGECPLCLREVNWLRRLDKHGRIRFVDITATDFDAASLGLTQDELMAKMHGRLADGTIVTGVEVFRYLYTAVGYGWLVAPTRLPIVKQGLDVAYKVFARNRLRFTGRCDAKSGCKVK